jgi:hypothetical protein
MTTPNPIPHLDEPAQQLARIRKLERDLESERANVARERRSNGSLALELFEARAEAKALAAELEEARLNFVRTGVAHSMNLQAEIDLRELRWTQLREQIKAQPPVALRLPGLVHALNLMDAPEWPESPIADSGEKSPSADTTLQDALKHIERGGVLEFNDGTCQHRVNNGRHEYRNRGPAAAYWTEWRESDPRHMVDRPGFYTLLPIEDAPSSADTAPVVTQGMAMRHYEAGGVIECAGGCIQRRKVGDIHECRSMCGGRWNDWAGLRPELAKFFEITPGYYRLLPIPQDNGAAT